MVYTIYKITNQINGKIYIGKHQTENPYDGYYGSGKLIKNAIKKYGKENFKKEILFVFETEIEMNSKEKELITEEFVSRKDTYNTGVGGEGGPHFKGKKFTPEARERMNNAMKGRPLTEEHKKKLSLSQKGKVIPENTKEKMRESATGRLLSDETKNKIKEARKKTSNFRRNKKKNVGKCKK
jgi:group I intron endonuclease